MATASNRKLTREQIHQVLWAQAAKYTDAPAAKIGPETRLVEDLGADSLDVVEFAMAVEEELDLTLPEELMEKQPNLGQLEQAIVDLVQG